MKTVKDLFVLDIMKQCKVLSGQSGLTRQVKNVNISDTPDIINYIEKNQLLLTTGYGFVEDTQSLYDLIVEMDKLNCAGIIIKIDRFLKKLPEEIIALSEELAFPIIHSPTELNLGSMSRHILNYLNDDETEQLYYALHFQKEFSKMMFEDYSVEALVEQLSLSIERPVLLLNHRAEEQVISNLAKTRLASGALEQVNQIIKENIQAARNGFSYIKPSKQYKPFTTFSIVTKNTHPSILVIFDSATLPYPSSQLAIEQASNVISFTKIKEEAVDENLRMLKNDFFSDLIENNNLARKDMIIQANYYGLEMEANSICIACTVDIKEDSQNDGAHLYEKRVGAFHHQITSLLEDAIIEHNLKATLFSKGIYFVIIAQFSSYTEEEVNKITELIQDVQSSIDEFTLSFGVSSVIQDLDKLGTAYEEALEALMQGYAIFHEEFIYFYKTKELKELLTAIPIKDLRALYENTLKTLAYPEGDDEELVRTIEVYLEHQCEITSTARALYVHRNTVKYRVKKAEEILGEPLKDPTNSLRIRVALMIGRILNHDV